MSPIDESFAYPLHWALKNGDWSTAGSLLTSGVDPNSADENGSTPLHVVCRRDDVDSAERFFALCASHEHEPLIDARNNEGKAPLHLALSHGLKNLAEFLLRRGADPNSLDAEGATPLRYVCRGLMDPRVMMKIFCQHIGLSDQEAAESLSYLDYIEQGHEKTFAKDLLPASVKEKCAAHLFVKLSRGFFRDWALESFVELTRDRMRLEYCEAIVDKLTNQDLCNICVAANV
ncbi:hypothetical protein TKK_0007132 [Trichogramma kaykai]